MAQIEIYNWLKSQRVLGNHSYFSIDEITKGVNSNGGKRLNDRIVRRAIWQLEKFGYVEILRAWDNNREWRVDFRVKDKYVEVCL